MKYIFSIFILYFSCPVTTTGQVEARDSIPTVYGYQELMPQFPGNVNEYLARNVRYPAEAAEAGISGRVKVAFCIDTFGNLDSITIAQSVHPLLDMEALRVVGNMPKWKPGVQDWVPVRVHFSLPISFSLDGKPIPEPELVPHVKDSLANNYPARYKGDWARYIAKHLNYPQEAEKLGIKGSVRIKFLVEPSGKVSAYAIDRPLQPSLDREAMRLAAKMTKHQWKPAVKDGKPIRSYLVLPFLFPHY